jgi:hypothetical protein
VTDLEAIFHSVLSARIPVAEGVRGLSLFAVLDLRSNPAYVHYKKGGAPDIPIEPRDVAAGLQRYLDRLVDEDELGYWATFITMTGAYHAPEPPAHDEDWYEEMWTVLDELATPILAGPITPEAVRDKLRRLDRYGVSAA